MKYLAAYCLLALSGKKDITAADIKKVLGEIAATTNDEDINRVITVCKAKPLHELIKEGTSNIGEVSSAPTAASSAPVAKVEEKKAAPKKEAKKEQPEAADEDFGGLFD